MRKTLVIDPITTDFFNNMTKNYLEEIKSPDIEIEVVNIKAGPSSIYGAGGEIDY
jgi:Asp/Glu/hydantoin racemase